VTETITKSEKHSNTCNLPHHTTELAEWLPIELPIRGGPRLPVMQYQSACAPLDAFPVAVRC